MIISSSSSSPRGPEGRLQENLRGSPPLRDVETNNSPHQHPSPQPEVSTSTSTSTSTLHWLSTHIRYLVVGLLCLGSFSNAMNRGLMNTAIIAMTPQSNWSLVHAQNVQPAFGNAWNQFKGGSLVEDDEQAYCPLHPPRKREAGKGEVLELEKQEEFLKPEFDWSEQRQNLVMGAFAVGYVVSLVPSGALTEAVGGARLAGVSGLALAIFTLLGPWAARSHQGGYWALFASRVAVGGAVAAMVPAFVQLVTRWVPDDEKR